MIVFVSNFVSPHTMPLCEQLYVQLNHEFLFVETMCMTKERRSLGYSKLKTMPFVVDYETFEGNKKYYQRVIDTSEVVLCSFGSIDNSLLENRIKTNKLTFLMSERIFKKSILKLIDPKFWKTLMFINKIKAKNFHLLCMGAYVSRDFGLCGFPKEKMWKFGYITYEPNWVITNKRTQDILHLLWVGRMIWWKTPFITLKVAEILKKKGLKFHLDVVGDGKLSEEFKSKLNKCKAKDMITYHGLKTGFDVQSMMQSSDILLCTSNRLEGWGAVVNEGMYNKCIVIASKSMGAAPFLIKDNKTGYLYQGGARALSDTIIRALNSKAFNIIGSNAYDYIKDNWSPQIASHKLFNLIDYVNGRVASFQQDGICSKA